VLTRVSGLDTAVVASRAQCLAPRLPGVPHIEILCATVGTGDRGVQVDACPQHILPEDVGRSLRLLI